ncbi:MAG: type I methionyl aminopeptidase [Waddliaceae bacterium]|nr:type I methionyl aminopeptidase [Waddliaceae bacterium]
MIGRNDPCWCGSQQKWKKCHYPDPGPQTQESLRKEYYKKHQILLKTPEQIDGIRKAGKLAASILEELCAFAKEGVTTAEIDQLSRKLHADAGATAAALNYGSPPFPGSICTSLNEMICHGIPNNVPLKDGDILNIDCASILNGYYGDCSKMVCIGNITQEKQLVVDVAYDSLMKSIEMLKPGVKVSEIGTFIQKYAEGKGCSVVYQFVGHGVGTRFHENPQVSHVRNSLHVPLAPGMTFTIEPMINAGTSEGIIDPENDWEARTADGRPSAQWEHTLLITEEGCEILTPWKR